MAGVKWTKEQQEAIYTRNCNLLVAAAAGSGKTAVLVQRIINIITDLNNPVDIDKLLVVTFTNAAASEMRERIAAAIIDKLEEEPNSAKLQRQLTLLPKASITTLHSFCLDIIRNNFHIIGLNPDFKISDATENILLKQETLEELFEKKYESEENQEFLNLVQIYCNNRDDRNLQDMVIDLYNFSTSFPWQEKWLKEAAEKFNVDNIDLKALDGIKTYLKYISEEIRAFKQKLYICIEIIEEEETLESYRENINDDLAMINDLIMVSETSWDNFVKSIKKIDFKSLKRCKKGVDKDKQEIVKKLREEVKKGINSIKDEVAPFSYEDIKEDFKCLYPVISSLCALVVEFSEEFSKKKRERGLIDFNDFEHMCLQILSKTEGEKVVPSEIALELRKSYEEILVDEYQDTNTIQETIINIISRKEEPNIFMVGDIKQSIYRFRQAKPEIFLGKYNSYSQEEGSLYRKVLLYKNFRSRREIIEGINFIFRQIMSESVGELEYDEEEKLNLGADYKEESDGFKVGGPVELHLIENKDKDELSEEALEENIEEDNPSNIQIEARMVANRINELIDNKNEKFMVFSKESGEYRDVTYRDIVVLLRSTQKWAPVFMEEFKEKGIPVYADTGTGYFQTIEIKTMMSLLQVIDNPIQDIPMLALMNSPIGGFTQEELIEIKINSKEDSYYEKMVDIVKVLKSSIQEINYSEEQLEDHIYEEQIEQSVKSNDNSIEVERDLLNKIEGFLTNMEMWREISIHMPLDEFIWFLYKSTGYYGYVGAMPAGEQRQANLKMLFQRAKQYQNTSYKGLFNFINFINRLKENSGDMGSAKIIGENENVVRIMSIHKSKGLEFPVVIVAGMGKKFNMMDINKRLLIHQELGFGPDCIDLEKRLVYPSLMKGIIRKKIKLESLSEEMRVLYVALTRAKEKLIITGMVKDVEKAISKWHFSIEKGSTKLSAYHRANADNYLDWIVPCVMRHEQGKKLLIKGDIRNIELLEDTSNWRIKLWSRAELLNSEQMSMEDIFSTEEVNNQNIELEDNIYKEVDKKLNYKYAYEESQEMPTVITVTELKRKFQEILDEEYDSSVAIPKLVKKPLFLLEKKGLTPAEKGTAMHAVMQRISFDRVEKYQDIEEQINTMIEKEFITEEEGKSVNINKIIEFFKSSIGKRMLNAEKVYREVPFHMDIKSTEIYKELPKDLYEGEKIMLQGIIDCYFEENGNIILLDYKTDYVENVEDIKERYKVQIEYYSKALESVTGRRVSEKYLYLFYNNSIVTI
ncbi:helicase-exonuclease AddAB subunit AddA [Clostridium sp. KNHs214]|uniref:helicase-exonuclease AddAB subunit AddA n=1 Tax=Clostridium sp. KNHs214 TaxID=1540257 RepID=UPI0005540698|nr:helicase-exonuclease AddAB subunit AddA [Clostridium sp. KNHs214]